MGRWGKKEEEEGGRREKDEKGKRRGAMEDTEWGMGSQGRGRRGGVREEEHEERERQIRGGGGHCVFLMYAIKTTFQVLVHSSILAG